jgi:hypothetical protein
MKYVSINLAAFYLALKATSVLSATANALGDVVADR